MLSTSLLDLCTLYLIMLTANNALLGGEVRVGIREQRKNKKIKGTTKTLMAILNISQRCMDGDANCAIFDSHLCYSFYSLVLSGCSVFMFQ